MKEFKEEENYVKENERQNFVNIQNFKMKNFEAEKKNLQLYNFVGQNFLIN